MLRIRAQVILARRHENLHVGIVPRPVEQQVAERMDAVVFGASDAKIRHQTARARRRLFGPGLIGRKTADALMEMIVGFLEHRQIVRTTDGECGVAFGAIRLGRHPVTDVGCTQREPVFEAPLIEQRGLVEEELLHAEVAHHLIERLRCGHRITGS